MELDPTYEFNAPKYVDFARLDEGYDTSDHWFDERSGDEGGIAVDSASSDNFEIGFTNATAAISAALAPVDKLQLPNTKSLSSSTPNKHDTEKDDKKKTILDKESVIDKSDHDVFVPRELDCIEDNVEGTAVINNNIDGEKHGSACNTSYIVEKTSPLSESYTIESTDAHSTSYTIKDEDKHSTSYIIESSDNEALCKNETYPKSIINTSVRTSDQATINYIQTPDKNEKKQLSQIKPVTPKTRIQPVRKSTANAIYYGGNGPKRKQEPAHDGNDPKKMRMTQSRKSAKIAADKMKLLQQQQTRDRKRVNEKNMKRMLPGKAFAPVRKTNAAISSEHSMSTRSDKSFANSLRKDNCSTHSLTGKPTKLVPFQFVLPDKMKVPGQNWESMAEATYNFQHKTPTRFRKKVSEEERNKINKPLQITKPVTPQLLSRTRARQFKIESSKDIEDKIVEQMKSYQFKATALNPKIIEMKGMYGVKQIPAPTSTCQKPFSFQVDQRANWKKGDVAEADTSTADKSKKFDLLKPTIPKPFSFEERDKERFTKKDEKIKNQLAEEKKLHDFRARMLPSFSPEVLPEVPTKRPTKPIPFGVSQYAELYDHKLEEKRKREEEEEKAKRMFKAQQCSVTTKEPFQPAKGLIPSTNKLNVVLHSDIRAAERSKFDSWLREKEKRDEETRLEFEREEKLREEKEIKQLRKDIVHKANPIRTFKPVEIKKSDIPLTEAKTPNLEVRRRQVFREIQKREEERN